MSFLDNLENNLKALENREERDPEKVKRDQERREAERNDALSRAPFVEALKKSSFTSELLAQCRAIGRTQRALVQFAWIGDNLRLDVPGKRMEFIATADGIRAILSRDGVESARISVDTATDDPGALARRWLE
jgi:hypothetical protein